MRTTTALYTSFIPEPSVCGELSVRSEYNPTPTAPPLATQTARRCEIMGSSELVVCYYQPSVSRYGQRELWTAIIPTFLIPYSVKFLPPRERTLMTQTPARPHSPNWVHVWKTLPKIKAWRHLGCPLLLRAAELICEVHGPQLKPDNVWAAHHRVYYDPTWRWVPSECSRRDIWRCRHLAPFAVWMQCSDFCKVDSWPKKAHSG